MDCIRQHSRLCRRLQLPTLGAFGEEYRYDLLRLRCGLDEFGDVFEVDSNVSFWPEGDIRRTWAIISATDPKRPVASLGILLTELRNLR